MRELPEEREEALKQRMIGIQSIYIASIITVAWWTMYEFDVVILADETGGYVAPLYPLYQVVILKGKLLRS